MTVAGRTPTPVAHVVLSLEVGGLERVVVTLARDQKRAGTPVRVYCLDSRGPLADELEDDGIACTLVQRRPGIDVKAASRLASKLRRDRMRIVHAHNYGALVHAAIAAALAGRLPVVYTAHGVNSAESAWPARLARVRLLHESVFVSADAERVARAAGTLRGNHVRVIHNGIDLERARATRTRAEVRAELGIPDAAPVLGTLARISPVKRHVDLLDAHRRVLAEIPGARCLIVGGGDALAWLKDEVRSRNLEDSVVLAGWRQDVPELLSAMDVFVLPSDSEGLSMTLLEAMAQRLPVVATSVGGNPEVVLDGVTGHLVPRRDPERLAATLVSLLRDPGARERMGAAGRQRVEEHFSRTSMVAAYRQLYERQEP